MRWKLKNPQQGETRIVMRFAIIPIRAGLFVRWLERVIIEQMYCLETDGYKWINTRFMDKEDI